MQLTDHSVGSRGAVSASGNYLRSAAIMKGHRGEAGPAASDFNVSYQDGNSYSRRRYDWELFGDEDGRIVDKADRRWPRRPVSCRGMRWTGPSSGMTIG